MKNPLNRFTSEFLAWVDDLALHSLGPRLRPSQRRSIRDRFLNHNFTADSPLKRLVSSTHEEAQLHAFKFRIFFNLALDFFRMVAFLFPV